MFHILQKKKDMQILTKADLDTLVVRHRMPLIMQLLHIGSSESPGKPSNGMILLFTKILESSLTIPLSDTLQMLLHHIRLMLGQLNPKVWWALADIIII